MTARAMRLSFTCSRNNRGSSKGIIGRPAAYNRRRSAFNTDVSSSTTQMLSGWLGTATFPYKLSKGSTAFSGSIQSGRVMMIEQLERIVAMLAERREMRYKTLVLWGSSDLEAGFSYGAMGKVLRARQSRFSPSPGTLYRVLSVVLWGAASGR